MDFKFDPKKCSVFTTDVGGFHSITWEPKGWRRFLGSSAYTLLVAPYVRQEGPLRPEQRTRQATQQNNNGGNNNGTGVLAGTAEQ